MTTPDGPFWALVKAEFRATWRGRWRWLWWLSALISVGVAALLPESSALGAFAWLAPFWLPVYWAPIVLGSDLLCLRFQGNPEPGREWPPQAFLARGLGRLAPVVAVIALSCFLAVSRHENGFDELSGLQKLSVVLTLITTHLALFAVSALVGSGSRRPRRLLVTLGFQVCSLGLGLALMTPGVNASSPWHEWLFHLTSGGPIALEMLSDFVVRQLVEGEVFSPQHPIERSLFASLVRLWLFFGALLWLGALARGRYLRRPYSIAPADQLKTSATAAP